MKPQRMTILTIDDTPANIRLLTHYLEKQGYRVLTAEDGFEGFKAAIQHHPDLVLLDVMMPGTDGYEVCELLKAEEETKDIPIVFLTAKADVEDRVRGFELGAVDYITKPFNLIEISARVKTHLRLKYLEKQQHQREKMWMQVQKLASLGAADAGFFAQLSRQTEAMQRILQTPGGPKHEDLARLRGMVDSARAVLSDLMAFSSSGSQDTDQIVLNDAVDSVQELVQSFAHNSIHFDVELPKTSPIVQGNLGWVHQTVLNLLLTAQESAIGGGTIKVRVAEGPAPDVDDGNGSAVYASVSVTDATPRKEQIKFDPESKLYTTAKNNLNAGIRLTAAHAIAERHGGMLRLNGGGGERLTVSLFFPIAKP